MDGKDAIIATVRDYWEGWFDGDAARMERALHPAFTKTGFGADASGPRVSGPMSAQHMIGWTRDGEGVAEKPADSGYHVTVDDTYHGIATVTVTSAIYHEYLHLVQAAEGWRLLHALYQRMRD